MHPPSSFARVRCSCLVVPIAVVQRLASQSIYGLAVYAAMFEPVPFCWTVPPCHEETRKGSRQGWRGMGVATQQAKATIPIQVDCTAYPEEKPNGAGKVEGFDRRTCAVCSFGYVVGRGCGEVQR